MLQQVPCGDIAAINLLNVRCCPLLSGKDVFWYNKGKEDMGVTQDELEAVKAREREMMAEVSAVLA
jgi:hypothetical protein